MVDRAGSERGQSVILTYLKMNLKALGEYRSDFLFRGLFMMFTNSIFYGTILYLANSLGGIGGFDYGEIVMAMAIAQISYVFGLNFFNGMRDLQMLIISGELDKLLIRPVPLYKHLLVYKFNHSIIGEIITAIGLLLLIPAQNWPFVLLFSVPSALILHFAVFIYCLSPFFIQQNSEHYTFDIMIGFLFYPPTIYDGFAKFISLFILPGAMISFGPLMIRQNPRFLFVYLGFLILLGITFAILFNKGVRRYESAGY